jgi:putative transposase
MRSLFILVAHLLVTLARLIRPGGVRAVAAESLAVKHQLLIMKRSQRRSPNLTQWDRVILGFCTLLVSPRRLGRMAVILKTSTLPSSPSPGEAKISFALQLQVTPTPRAQGTVERVD